MYRATFFKDRILVQCVHHLKFLKVDTEEDGIVYKLHTPRTRAHRAWLDKEFADSIELSPPEWRIEAHTQGKTIVYTGRIEAMNTSQRGPIAFFGRRENDKTSDRSHFIILPEAHTLDMIQPDVLTVRKPQIKRFSQLTLVYELDAVSWTFSHLMRFAEDKRSSVLETIVELPALDVAEYADSAVMTLKELRFVNADYIVSEPRRDRAYGTARFAATARAAEETAAPASEDATTNEWGQWVVKDATLMRHRTHTLRVLSTKFPASMSLVYLFEGLEHQHPNIFIDCSSRECQEILQKIEAGPVTIYDETGKSLSQGSQLNAHTKRINMGKFFGISIKCQRIVDNLQERYHDEKFVLINKTDATHDLAIWQPRDAIKVVVKDQPYLPELDAEMQANVIKVPLKLAPGRHEVAYRWFHS